MRPVVLTKTLAAASVNCIAQAQSLAGAGNFTLNGAAASGGVAVLDTARRVLVTSAGNDSGIAFTVFGSNQAGAPIQETLAGANAGAVATNQDFATVSRVASSGATASTVEVGTNGVGSTPWALVDPHVTPTMMGLGVTVAGTVNFTVEYTYDDPLNQAPGAFPTPFAFAALAGKTADSDAVLNQTVRAVRLTLNSNTPPGAATLTAIQAGIRQ
jgi:hypothetical protein